MQMGSEQRPPAARIIAAVALAAGLVLVAGLLGSRGADAWQRANASGWARSAATTLHNDPFAGSLLLSQGWAEAPAATPG